MSVFVCCRFFWRLRLRFCRDKDAAEGGDDEEGAGTPAEVVSAGEVTPSVFVFFTEERMLFFPPCRNASYTPFSRDSTDFNPDYGEVRGGDSSNRNQIRCVDVQEYLFFGSIVGSDSHNISPPLNSTILFQV